MKINKTISIDLELANRLAEQGVNVSKICNDALWNYFHEPTLEKIQTSKKELETQIGELNTEKQLLMKKQAKEKLVKTINLPEKLKNWMINKNERPTPIEVSEFAKNNGLGTTDSLEVITQWRKIHAK